MPLMYCDRNICDFINKIFLSQYMTYICDFIKVFLSQYMAYICDLTYPERLAKLSYCCCVLRSKT